MSDSVILFLSWLAVALHAVAALATLRHWTKLPLVPWLDLVVGICLLAYWVPRWFKGQLWYVTDKLVPLYALMVCILALGAITGRFGGMVPQWIIFVLHALVLLAAALFFSLFRMDRLF